ncbi:MAG TPA: nuclear transport factor 2 family protein [Bacteroidales bacterium]|nr:nuclear transport factor 2 family protein [Bacteroidales bacterium]
MKRLLLAVICIAAFVAAKAQTADEALIREVIMRSYVEGIHNRNQTENIEKGFHPGFEMLSLNNNLLDKYPIYSWLEQIRKSMQSGQKPGAVTTAEIPLVDVAGNAAIARVELFRDGKHIFTDYMALYRFDEGWKIVSKTYYRIPD